MFTISALIGVFTLTLTTSCTPSANQTTTGFRLLRQYQVRADTSFKPEKTLQQCVDDFYAGSLADCTSAAKAVQADCPIEAIKKCKEGKCKKDKLAKVLRNYCLCLDAFYRCALKQICTDCEEDLIENEMRTFGLSNYKDLIKATNLACPRIEYGRLCAHEDPDPSFDKQTLLYVIAGVVGGLILLCSCLCFCCASCAGVFLCFKQADKQQHQPTRHSEANKKKRPIKVIISNTTSSSRWSTGSRSPESYYYY